MSEFARRKGDGALLAELAAGADVRTAAKRARVSESTAHRRLNDPAFRRELAAARAAMVDAATGGLAAAATAAVQTLRLLLDAEGESVRLGAARSIIEMGAKLREVSELAERIAALEEHAATAAATASTPRMRAVR